MLKCFYIRMRASHICAAWSLQIRMRQCPFRVQAKTFSVYSALKREWKQPKGYDTGISIYQPFTKEKVPLVSEHTKLIKWYMCGPTVYDSAHIGHASSYVRQDVVRRILQDVFDIDCISVMGITDVDDKIITKAQETNQPVEDITTKYESEFFSDMSRLGVLRPTMTMRVTEHIPTIVSFIEGLERLGYAYQAADGSVYFDVDKYGQYGVFSLPEANDQDQAGVKSSTRDFALWKSSKPGEIAWPSPWGSGRPGWHIECSAMASAVLGSTFDMHSGGEDLMFPHHENELAQSCAFHDTHQWVNYWLHTGKLFISGQQEKMSKSLKNTISISDFLESYTSNHFRMLCLLSSYRKRIEFSDQRMAKAVSTVNTFHNFLSVCEAYAQGQAGGDVQEVTIYEKLSEAKVKIYEAYADDFNTPQALAVLMRLVKTATPMLNTGLQHKQNSPVRGTAAVTALALFVERHLNLLGLHTAQHKEESSSNHLQTRVDSLVDLIVSSRDCVRQVARDKNSFISSAEKLGIPLDKAAVLFKTTHQPLWRVSDDMRAQLLKRADAEIRDGKDGSTWSVVERIKENKTTDTKEKTVLRKSNNERGS